MGMADNLAAAHSNVELEDDIEQDEEWEEDEDDPGVDAWVGNVGGADDTGSDSGEEGEEEVVILPPSSQGQQTRRFPGGGQTSIKFYFKGTNNGNIIVNSANRVTVSHTSGAQTDSRRGGAQTSRSHASVAAVGGAERPAGKQPQRRNPDLPPHLQQKSKNARAVKKASERAAAAKELVHSLHEGPPVVFPAVDTYQYLPQVSSLLTSKQSAAIHMARREGGKERNGDDALQKQIFLQLCDRFSGRSKTDAQILSCITSHCYGKEGTMGRKINARARTTKLGWIKSYRELMADGRKEEALQLVAVLKKKAGAKPVFTEDVEKDIAKYLAVWLGATTVGVPLDYIIAHLQGVVDSGQKVEWCMAIAKYNQNRARPFEFGREWVRDHMHKWGFSFRVGTTVARKLPPNVDEVHQLFVIRLAYLLRHDLPNDVTMLQAGERVPVKMIPPALCVNADQGGIPWVAFRNATWAPTGAKAVPLSGQDDKRQMTAVLASDARGVLLPLQVIMAGKTDQSLPSEKDRAPAESLGFHYTVTQNHWASLETTKEYVTKVLVPFFNKERESLGLPQTFPSVWIIDCWSVHISPAFLQWMADRYPNIRLLFVPANCTGRMQPADLAGQREMKCCLRAIGTLYATVQVREQFKKLDGLPEEEKVAKIKAGVIKIDTSISTLKPFLPSWHVTTWKHLQAQGALLKGWQQSRLLEAFEVDKGNLYYTAAQAKMEAGTLWINTKAVIPGGVPVPARLERGQVASLTVNADGEEDVVVVDDVELEEPKESETDVAEMEKERARLTSASEEVSMSGTSVLFPQSSHHLAWSIYTHSISCGRTGCRKLGSVGMRPWRPRRRSSWRMPPRATH